MGNDDIGSSSQNRFDARARRAVERRGHDQNNQRQNRKSRSSNLEHDLSRLGLAAFALYVEAASAELANGLAASAVEADGKVQSRLEAFTRRVIERFDRVLETASAPPHAKVLRF